MRTKDYVSIVYSFKEQGGEERESKKLAWLIEIHANSVRAI